MMAPARRCSDIVARLESLRSEENVDGMKRYGVTGRAYGIRIPDLRAIARDIGSDHDLAMALWNHPARETRILASMIDEPEAVTRYQMERWVSSFDTWEICDQCCMNLFRKTCEAPAMALLWSQQEGQYVRRAGYVLMATLAVHRKDADEVFFTRFFPAIMQGADDERRHVKQAVSWALRQIGKRDRELNEAAISVARDIMRRDSPAARWIARDVLRELTSEKVQQRLL
jgi:3-methyladenine DNA glycosylase AlkD